MNAMRKEAPAEAARSAAIDVGEVWDQIRVQLREQGIDLDQGCCGPGEGGKVRVVCVAPDMRTTLAETSGAPRDQVVMVRVDEETSHALDAWVETGTVRSRSEAAAVFIREGLKVRANELEQLREAVREVEEAKSRLRKKTREVLGGGLED